MNDWHKMSQEFLPILNQQQKQHL